MSDQNDSADKSYEPTQKKLDDARKKGDVPKSTDLSYAAAIAGLLLAFVVQGGSMMDRLGSLGMHFLANADLIGGFEQTGLRPAQLGVLMGEVLRGLTPLFLFPFTLVLLSILAQRAFVIAPERLKPKLNKIGLWSNAKKKFGPSGLVEFLKSFFKMCLYIILFVVLMKKNLGDMQVMSRLEPIMAFREIAALCFQFFLFAFLISVVIGVGDALWQQSQFIVRNRMTHKEMRDEVKDSEGDPMMKQQRRQKAEEIARMSALAAVPKATVVVMNPTHYAVALSWDQETGAAPVCTAKGTDELALAMKRLALESGVPVREDPPTARALHAAIEVGDEIPRSLFVPVAAAINYAMKLRKTRWT